MKRVPRKRFEVQFKEIMNEEQIKAYTLRGIDVDKLWYPFEATFNTEAEANEFIAEQRQGYYPESNHLMKIVDTQV
jgi:hypothetical protein